MDYKQLMKDIKNKEISKVYLFYGEEFLLSQMMLDNLKKAIIKPEFEQLNFHTIDGKNATTEEIINACETLPFMDDTRLVVVSEIPLLSGTSNFSTKDVDRLCDYIGQVPGGCHLIFTSKKIDKKRKLVKVIEKHGALVEYSKLDKRDLSKWIAKRFKLEGKSIGESALQLFIESSDYLNKDSKANLSDIENEIKKLLAYTREKTIIEIQDVEGSIEVNIDTNIFKMLELIGTKSVGQGLKLMNILFQDGEPPIKVLFMIVRQFRLIYQCKFLQSRGYSTNDISKMIGERSFVVTKALTQAQKFSYERLISIYDYAAKMDIKMKSGQIDPKLALEMLLMKVI
ncbi:DNA polymerase III delta subunit [Alkalibaculum bacchi]|uniref:DNA polymerase III subunit delta n=1 Tax=Alkalibaculum bacchi TaxID=645887 RepID=A0A366I5X6_9FIRM|nr:DNA polymerase III subunit delta [Alkalibaculum bacchi]RBP63893.1 DNA polymerase III delta subunit [Alkalibaculum bacchi]